MKMIKNYINIKSPQFHDNEYTLFFDKLSSMDLILTETTPEGVKVQPHYCLVLQENTEEYYTYEPQLKTLKAQKKACTALRNTILDSQLLWEEYKIKLGNLSSNSLNEHKKDK